MKRIGPALLVLAAACGHNALPPAGAGCEAVPATVASPDAVRLVPGRAAFDDLRFSPSLGRVVAAPEGAGMVALVGPEPAMVTRLEGLPAGVASADGGDGFVFAADRGADEILIVDLATGQVAGRQALLAGPDYVRYEPALKEVWVTEPGADQIEILRFTPSPPALAAAGKVATPGGPEGVAIDAAHQRAYAHASGDLLVIDMAARSVIARWSTGCSGSHGIPVVDADRGMVLAGCSSRGGGAVLDTRDGHVVAGYETGSGEAVLGASPSLHHFYLRGDPGTQVAVLGACASGAVSHLGDGAVTERGHGMAGDASGNLWVADAAGGGLLRVRDPFAASP